MKRLVIVIVAFAFGLASCALSKSSVNAAQVQSALDIMVQEDFASLKGKKIGLISNHSALDRQSRNILDLMQASKNVQLVAVFAPEHGFYGKADEKIKNTKDEKTGMMIYSLYDDTRVPTKEELKGIDTLVFDIQDIGARFYTYTSTIAM